MQNFCLALTSSPLFCRPVQAMGTICVDAINVNRMIIFKPSFMAEIHVEPKKNTSGANWLWIVLLILVLAAVIYYFMSRNDTNDTVTPPANTTGYLFVATPQAAGLIHCA